MYESVHVCTTVHFLLINNFFIIMIIAEGFHVQTWQTMLLYLPAQICSLIGGGVSHAVRQNSQTP